MRRQTQDDEEEKRMVKLREGWARQAAKQTGSTLRRLHKGAPARQDTPRYYEVVEADGRVLVEAGSLNEAADALEHRRRWHRLYHHLCDLFEDRAPLMDDDGPGATAEQVAAFEAAALVEIAADEAASDAADAWFNAQVNGDGDAEKDAPEPQQPAWRAGWLRALDAIGARGKKLGG